MFPGPTEIKPLERYRLLGRSGLRVSPLILGAMNFGTNWSGFMGEITKAEAEQIFDKYVTEGGNHIDTANKYQEGQSEEWLGEWIEQRGIRENLVIATKYSLPTPTKGININNCGNHRKNMFNALKNSLARLRTTYVDILYVHFWDFTTPVEEIMRSLNDLVTAGKVHYLGVSDTPSWRVAQMNTLARLRGWAEFVCYQGQYHLGCRDMEREIIPMCNELGLGIVSWGVLGQGKYTGRFKRGEEDKGGRKMLNKMSDKDYDIADVVSDVAKEVGRSPSQVCLAWMLNQPNNFPLLGCRKLSQLEDNLASLTFTLTEQQMTRINAVATVELGWPHTFVGVSVETCPWIK